VLRPQSNGIREATSLDGLWDFAVDGDGRGHAEGWWRSPLTRPRQMPVPASYNDVLMKPGVREHVGDVWYQRTAWVPRGWAGQRVVLRFDAATHRAVVWVDDKCVAEHEGGYTPFEVDLTGRVRPGESFRLTVAVNNELTFQSIPPGAVVETPDGRRSQRYYHDFFNYSGLARSVWLLTTSRTHIDDVTVVTDVVGRTGRVTCRTSISPAEGTRVRVALRDATGELVAEAEGADATLDVPDAQLWEPGEGYLYALQVELIGDDGVIDRYELPVGIRTVQVQGTSFLINGKPFYFRGFGMHEDHDVRGKGHDDVSMVHDFELLRWTGANSFRTSHYPYAEEILDYADRHGIVVIDEAAAVGIDLSVGRSFGAPVLETYSDETINGTTQEVHRQAIAELIDRDKNHPSVVVWCIANEPQSTTEGARAYFEPLFKAAREADPTRPVGFVSSLMSAPATCRVTDLGDVVMVNRYYGWYIEPGNLVVAEQALETELQEWITRYAKPVIVTEYGADTISGMHSTQGELWSEEFQVSFLQAYHRVFDRVPGVVGEHVWNFADFMTKSSILRVGGNKKGVFTRDRRPKMAAHELRRRWLGQA
jgi:beta-glucuronidase